MNVSWYKDKLYCGTHYPPNIKARDDAKSEVYKKEREAKNKAYAETQAKIKAYPDLVKALIQIMEYDHIPPGIIARKVLKKHKIKL